MTNMTGFGSVDEPRQFAKFLSKRIEGEPDFTLAGAEAVALPAGQGWRERIDAAHRDEHGRFVYVTDKEGDVWTMPRWHWIRSALADDWRWVAEGDCEDWALYMVTVLLALDVPPGALRLAECRIPGGQGHAVLTVEMEDTTLVSDVRQTGVPAWDSPLFQGYEWLVRQVPGRSEWERIGIAPTLADLLGGSGGGA